MDLYMHVLGNSIDLNKSMSPLPNILEEMKTRYPLPSCAGFDIWSQSLRSLYFVFILVRAGNPFSHKYVVAKGKVISQWCVHSPISQKGITNPTFLINQFQRSSCAILRTAHWSALLCHILTLSHIQKYAVIGRPVSSLDSFRREKIWIEHTSIPTILAFYHSKLK